MTQFLDVLPEELDDKLQSTRHLRDVRVHISQNRRVLVLEMIWRGRAVKDVPKNNEVEVFALSPASAAQLSRHLDAGVQEYLYGKADPKDAES